MFDKNIYLEVFSKNNPGVPPKIPDDSKIRNHGACLAGGQKSSKNPDFENCEIYYCKKLLSEVLHFKLL